MAFTPRWARAKRPRVVGPWETYISRILTFPEHEDSDPLPSFDDTKRLVAQALIDCDGA